MPAKIRRDTVVLEPFRNQKDGSKTHQALFPGKKSLVIDAFRECQIDRELEEEENNQHG